MNVTTSAKSASKGFYLINIGSSIGATKNAICKAEVEQAFTLADLNGQVLETFPEAKSEETFLVSVYVRELNAAWFLADLAKIAASLSQDCVSAWHPVLNEGFLVGAGAHKFGGVFSAEWFQIEAGVTLADLPAPFVPSRREDSFDDVGEPLCT